MFLLYTFDYNVLKFKHMITFRKLFKNYILVMFLFFAEVGFSQSLNLTLTQTNITCSGLRDGSITAICSGGTAPYSYIWSNGETTASISNLQGGYYHVVVSDVNDEKVEGEVTLIEPERLVTAITTPRYNNGFNVSCHFCFDGQVYTSVSGGVPPYSYFWSDGAVTANRTNLNSGNFQLLITDANGCSNQHEFGLSGPDRDDWQTSGNAGSTPGTQFIGTSDNKDFIIKTNATERARFKSNGDFNISSLIGSGYNIVMSDPNGKLIRSNSLSGIPECSLPWEMCGNNIGVMPNAFIGTKDGSDLIFKTNANGGGGENMRIKIDGKIGVGTSNPSEKFEVEHNDGVGLSGGMKLSNKSGSNYNSEIKFSQGNTDYWSIGNDVLHNTSDNFFIYDNNIMNSSFGATRFLINGEGKIGIGEENPSEKLQVTNGSLYLKGENQGLIIDANSDKRIGFMKYYGKEAGLWRVSNQSFEIGRVNVSALPGTPNATDFITDLLIKGNGNIGIGAPNPSEKLEVDGKGKFTHLQMTSFAGSAGKLLEADPSGNIVPSSISISNLGLWSSTGSTVYYNSGKVFIGMSNCTGCLNSGYSLYVNDGIMTRDVLVTAQIPFPDYVFDKSYKRMSLYELETYINKNHRLPDMPSAKEIESKNGFEVGEIITKLLKQNEEQALYLIEQQKQIDNLMAKLNRLEKIN